MPIPIGKQFEFIDRRDGRHYICEVIKNDVEHSILHMHILGSDSVFRCHIRELGRVYKPYYGTEANRPRTPLQRTTRSARMTRKSKPRKGQSQYRSRPSSSFSKPKSTLTPVGSPALDVKNLPRPKLPATPSASRTKYGYNRMDGSPYATPTPEMGYHHLYSRGKK